MGPKRSPRLAPRLVTKARVRKGPIRRAHSRPTQGAVTCRRSLTGIRLVVPTGGVPGNFWQRPASIGVEAPHRGHRGQSRRGPLVTVRTAHCEVSHGSTVRGTARCKGSTKGSYGLTVEVATKLHQLDHRIQKAAASGQAQRRVLSIVTNA